MDRNIELKYIKSIYSLLTSYFLLFINLYILKLPGMFIYMTISHRLNKSNTIKTPLINFYLLTLF